MNDYRGLSVKEIKESDDRFKAMLFNKADYKPKSYKDRQCYRTPVMASMLTVKTAGEWLEAAHALPTAKRLFGHFWLQNELSILFADTNMGKSILAVQIGDALSRQGNVLNCENQLESRAKVLYIDFELSAKQFEARYTDRIYGRHPFNEYFFRAEFDPSVIDSTDPNHHYSLRCAIEEAVIATGAQVLIIDNLTWLGNGAEKAAEALTLMKHLKELKRKFNLSILALAHTPKRNGTKPITVNDLQGSKMLINFCDSAFAIGKSYTMPGHVYVKQIKQRGTHEQYGADNVCLAKIKKDFEMLHMELVAYANENEHLYSQRERDKKLLEQKAGELKGQGLTLQQIANKLDITKSKAHRLMQKLEEKAGEEVSDGVN